VTVYIRARQGMLALLHLRIATFKVLRLRSYLALLFLLFQTEVHLPALLALPSLLDLSVRVHFTCDLHVFAAVLVVLLFRLLGELQHPVGLVLVEQ